MASLKTKDGVKVVKLDAEEKKRLDKALVTLGDLADIPREIGPAAKEAQTAVLKLYRLLFSE